MIVMDLEFARFTAERRRYMMVNTKGKVNYYRKERERVQKKILGLEKECIWPLRVGSQF
jgi:hypothetical protein